MFDWDYSMYLKELCPYINPREYKTWRGTGLAFEYRLTENKIPNRTFASYIPGYNVRNLITQLLLRENQRIRSLLEAFGEILSSRPTSPSE
jgi:hypothetical protein